MYEPDTILALKNPRDPDPETNEPFPYNKVKVVGPSPINHGITPGGQWEGANGAGVIITALSNFGSTLDEPYGKLVALYDVVEVPEREVDQQPKIKVINSSSGSAGPTPEEVFAVKAPGDPDAPRRPGAIKAAESPLEDPRPKATDGPLGPVHVEGTVTDTGAPTTTRAQ